MIFSNNEMDTLLEGLTPNDTKIQDTEKANMKIILSNQAREINNNLNEGTISGDVQQFVPIFLPLVRRVMPKLIANELVGIQPLSTPTGFIFAINFRYTGNGDVSAKPTNSGQIVEFTKLDEAKKLQVGKTLKFTNPAVGQAAAVVIDDAKVLYVEGAYAVVDKTGIVTGATIGAGTNDGAGVGADVVANTYSNELSFEKVLKGYSGSHDTAKGETLATDMSEIGFNIERKSVEAKTRKLKAKYTIELYQDLKAIHGLNADEELINMMSIEVESELNREIIDYVNSLATVTPDFNIDGIPGRYEIEKFAHIGVRISQEAREIARTCRRGVGNVIIASPKVVTILESLNGYRPIQYSSDISNEANPGVVGYFDNKKVIIDIFAKNEYLTILYKGTDRRDAIAFYAPYVPMSFIRTTNVESGQPAIILASRYGLVANPLSPELYARTFAVNFNNIKSLA